MTTSILNKVWDGAGETWEWLRGVLLGEWQDDQTISQVVANALAGFTPGVGSILTLRDLLAVVVRLAKHPEKREDIEQWILLIAMLLPLILTALGALAVGVGALVGAELGGFLRALALTLVKKGGLALKALVEFFQHHGYGDVVKALRQVKFAKYQDALVKGLGEQLDKLIALVRAFDQRLRSLHPESLPQWIPGRDKLVYALAHCPALISQLEEVRRAALKMIPQSLIELDRRLGALLAGDIKAAAQTTHAIATGQEAPKVAKLEAQPSAKDGHAKGQPAPTLRNPEPPEPGNTRRLPERRTIALAGKREYGIVDEAGKPVGAKPYKKGVTMMEHPPIRRDDWIELGQPKVKEGWPDMGKEYAPRKFAADYANFSGELRAASVKAGSKTTFKRVVAHDKPSMDAGPYYNRELPLDGADLRSGSAVKEGWNSDGQYVELRIPPKGDPIWRDLHALQEKAAGGPVPFKEELKFWEGPASSQAYEIDKVAEDWYLAGGKPQQFLDRDQTAMLKERGFVGQRKATNFPDFDPKIGNIVPKDGPHFEVVPLNEAMPAPKEH
jgi:hypothetical protein